MVLSRRFPLWPLAHTLANSLSVLFSRIRMTKEHLGLEGIHPLRTRSLCTRLQLTEGHTRIRHRANLDKTIEIHTRTATPSCPLHSEQAMQTNKLHTFGSK